MSKVPFKNVSIILPFFKDLDILSKSIASLFNQSYPKENYEIIISCDTLNSKVQTIFKNLPPSPISIKIIEQKHLGYRISTVRNKGIISSKSDFIIIIDFDIICPPHFIESHMNHHNQSDFVLTIAERIFIDSSSLTINDILFNSKEKLNQLKPVKSISNNSEGFFDKRIPFLKRLREVSAPFNFVYGFNMGFSRDIAIDAGLFDEDFNGCPGYEDIEFAYRLTERGVMVLYVPEAYVYHQENSVVSKEERLLSYRLNLPKLHIKVPKIKEFRKKIGEKHP